MCVCVCDAELHMRPHLPRFYHKNFTILYFINTIIHNFNCRLLEDGVLTPKHIGIILILIYTTYLCICCYNNKYLLKYLLGFQRENLSSTVACCCFHSRIFYWFSLISRKPQDKSKISIPLNMFTTNLKSFRQQLQYWHDIMILRLWYLGLV